MKVLFFTPFGHRNGAEMMLWNLLKHIDKSKFSCALFCRNEGPLLSELSGIIPCYTLPKQQVLEPITILKRLNNKISNRIKKIKSYKEYVLGIHNDFKPDIWYINTILCPEAVSLAVELNIPYAVHFHDLLFLYQHIGYKELKECVENADLLVGCSQIVVDRLRIMGGKHIALQYECVDFDKIYADRNIVSQTKINLKLNYDFVWVMSGSIEYRKGTDFVPDIAKNITNKNAAIVWLGGGETGYLYYIEQELKYYGINNVFMLGAKSADYYDYLSLADGLVLTSREDPFPLVMIEAAALGLPIVAFNSGGVKEFVKDGMGVVIDSGDVKSLINAMSDIMDETIKVDSSLSIKRAKEFDASVQALKWQEMMLTKYYKLFEVR